MRSGCPRNSKAKVYLSIQSWVFYFSSHKIYIHNRLCRFAKRPKLFAIPQTEWVTLDAFYACYCFRSVCTRAWHRFLLSWWAARACRPRPPFPWRWRRSCRRAAPCSAGELSWSTFGPPEPCRALLGQPVTTRTQCNTLFTKVLVLFTVCVNVSYICNIYYWCKRLGRAGDRSGDRLLSGPSEYSAFSLF